MRRLAYILSGLLESDERATVLGDLAEFHADGAQALRDVLGLLARRQAAIWMDWRPWTVLVFLVLPISMLMSLISRITADGSAITLWLYFNNWDWTLFGIPAFRHDFPSFMAAVLKDYLTLICWSWIAGFVIGALSRWAVPVTGTLFCFMVALGGLAGVPLFFNYLFPGARNHHPNDAAFAVTFYRVFFPVIIQTLLVLLPSVWGMRHGVQLRLSRASVRSVLWTAVILACAAMAVQFILIFNILSPYFRLSIWTSGPIRLLLLVIYWPVLYWITKAANAWKEKKI
jgi:hypothetical protein